MGRPRTPNRYEHMDNGTTKLIVSSKTFGEIISYIDTEDYPELSQFHFWGNCDSSKNLRIYMNYMNQNNTPITRFIKRKELDVNHQVDYQDKNTLNNTKQNLYIKPRSSNARNSGSSNNSSSPYLGVCLNNRKNDDDYYRAAISVNNKSCFLISSSDEHLCGLAYIIAAQILFPETANIITNLKLLPEAYKDTKGIIYDKLVSRVIARLIRCGHLDKDLNPIYT